MKYGASSDSTFRSGYTFRVIALLLAVTGLLIPVGTIVYLNHRVESVGIKQPIPFSHKLHSGKKEISCYLCHPGARVAAKPGIPPMETCMLCHEKIIVHYPPIREVRQSYARGIPISWEEVIDLAEYSHFSHEVHMMKGFDCGHCHGDVKNMDRIVEVIELNMGFCVQCHRDNGASHDCFICHR